MKSNFLPILTLAVGISFSGCGSSEQNTTPHESQPRAIFIKSEETTTFYSNSTYLLDSGDGTSILIVTANSAPNKEPSRRTRATITFQKDKVNISVESVTPNLVTIPNGNFYGISGWTNMKKADLKSAHITGEITGPDFPKGYIVEASIE